MKPLPILPAIDLKGGRCVRLRQGRADDETVYSTDPVAVARDWKEQGGAFLHVVDLDGAFEGRPMHAETVRRIAAEVGIPLEIGGGLRTDADIDLLLDAGASRVILGTRACAAPDEVRRLVARYGAHLAIGIDARDGFVQVKGWVETTSRRAVDLAREMDACGVRTIIFTDTSRDGMLAGLNTASLAEVCRAVGCGVIASGGVTTVDDIRALRRLEAPNLAGAIVGKALYEGRVKLPDLIAAGNEL